MAFKAGDYVKKNPATWIANDFDSWGRGRGIGQVVEPPFDLGPDRVDVRWAGGRCVECIEQLLPVKGAEVDSAANTI